MKKKSLHILIALSIAALSIWSCSKNDDDNNNITSFTIDSSTGTINNSSKKVLIYLPYEADFTHVVPKIEVSNGATITPGSEEAVDASDTVFYKVTARNGAIKDYSLLTYRRDPLKAAAVEYFALKIDSKNIVARILDTIITVEVPQLAVVTSITPTMSISKFATIEPSMDLPQDFSAPFKYTLTAQDDTVKRNFWVEIKRVQN